MPLTVTWMAIFYNGELCTSTSFNCSVSVWGLILLWYTERCFNPQTDQTLLAYRLTSIISSRIPFIITFTLVMNHTQ